MNEYPYAYFVQEHLFIAPMVVSNIMGINILYNHGKAMKSNLFWDNWNNTLVHVNNSLE